ncbi:MAG: Sugar transferase, PEP-CTERM system associated [Parcubacteria group bacterium GW2011_GWC2_42_6]|nr:MAG: Sugar transferase, PEP-CTERM system associated [Parcubacteria group bacterium GW2011_GWA2_42_11]KKS66910.1 MAG: Sugar transferase, PEP-CTERM system associated [Parcubacteria group bacterium GW2011_GWC2_42_6]
MGTTIIKIKRIILILGDILILYSALILTLALRYQQNWQNEWQNHFIPFSIIYLLWLLVFYILGLYDLSLARNNLYFFITLTKALAINAGLAVIFFYFIPFFGITPKTNLFINLAIFAILFVSWRQLYNLFIKNSALLNNVLIIGRNPETDELIRYIKDNPQIGYRIKKIVDLKEVNLIFNLIEIITKEKIQIVVTSINPQKNINLIQNLYQCIPLNIILADLPAFYEKTTGKIPVSAIEEIWFLQNLMADRKSFFELMKRAIDIAVSFIGGIITLSLLPIIALLIKINSSGPIFIRQKRVGQNNKIFNIIKFRSMYALAPDGSAEKNGAECAKEKDERITRVGKFLRKIRLDELPQLWNVFRGDMTFVGPRPERPEFAFAGDLLEKIPFYQIRHILKPGLTGWAQIKYPYGSSIQDTLQKLQYDLYYVKNRGFILDLAIILKTIRTVLSAIGR